MTCRDVLEYLADYLGGALAPEGVDRFEHHLAGCPSCVAYLESYRETVRLGKDALTEPSLGEVPEDLVAAILASLPPAA